MEILHLIDRIESLIEASAKVPLTHKVMIDEQHLYEIIDQMRATVPEDVKEAQRLLQQRETLIAEAQREAQRVLDQAEREAREKIENSDFVQLAQTRAEEITAAAEERSNAMLAETEEQAQRRREEVDRYSLEVLRKLDSQLTSVLANIQRGIQALEEQKEPQA